ncbi:MAG: DndE family protein, partial [Cyanobacteria bacterium J06649_11]
MTINVNTSEANKARVVDLTNQLKLGPENNIARIALAYSLGQDRRLNLRDIRDSKGKSYKENTFFGRYKDLYVALICQHYGLFRNDESIPKYVKMHVDDGLELIHKLLGSSKNYSGLDFLLQNVSRGVESIVHMAYTPETVKNHNSIVKDSPYFINPIEITVGKDSKGKTINLRFNHKDYNNSHIAIAGNTGTGKTRFALHFIKDLVTQANGNVNYIYLDFKGLK